MMMSTIQQAQGMGSVAANLPKVLPVGAAATGGIRRTAAPRH